MCGLYGGLFFADGSAAHTLSNKYGLVPDTVVSVPADKAYCFLWNSDLDEGIAMPLDLDGCSPALYGWDFTSVTDDVNICPARAALDDTERDAPALNAKRTVIYIPVYYDVPINPWAQTAPNVYRVFFGTSHRYEWTFSGGIAGAADKAAETVSSEAFTHFRIRCFYEKFREDVVYYEDGEKVYRDVWLPQLYYIKSGLPLGPYYLSHEVQHYTHAGFYFQPGYSSSGVQCFYVSNANYNAFDMDPGCYWSSFLGVAPADDNTLTFIPRHRGKYDIDVKRNSKVIVTHP